ncbi:MAG TPA: DUF883 family protein [Casimicrobiaceae bacterium]|nr:DUF883 family protein [Casimicrobiaceae bacterium]
MNDFVIAGRDEAAANLRRLVDGTEELMETLRKNGGGQYRRAMKRIERDIERAREQLGDLQDTVGGRTRAAVRTTDRLVRAHPWESAGAAAAMALFVGGALGVLVRDRFFR